MVHALKTERPEGLSQLPLTTRFRLEGSLTTQQLDFLDQHGFLVFEGVVSRDEVAMVLAEMDQIEARWVAEDRRKVNGIPIFYGRWPDGRPLVQRFPFSSLFSDGIKELVHDERFDPIRALVGEGARVGDREKDGVVINRYVRVPGSVYPRLGWHTDGLRDLFYLRMPKRMLNIGLHLDDCPADNGGLRLIPGTHHQGFASMCFHKMYFVSHAPDPREVAVETKAGDLTVHDGRLWHRVEASPKTGLASLRRSMYVPYLTDSVQPKDEASPTPLYHRVGQLTRWVRGRLQR